MPEKHTMLDERTKIPLILVLGAIPVIVGGIIWLTTIESRAAQALEVATEARHLSSSAREMLIDVRERVIRIEERVNRR